MPTETDTPQQDPFDAFLASRDKPATPVPKVQKPPVETSKPKADPFDSFLATRNATADTEQANKAAAAVAERPSTAKVTLPKVESSIADKVLGALAPPPEIAPVTASPETIAANLKEAATMDPMDVAARGRAGLPLNSAAIAQEEASRAKGAEALMTGSRKMPIPALTMDASGKPTGVRLSSVGELTDLNNEYLNRPEIPKTRAAAMAAGMTADAVRTLNDMFLSPVGIVATGTGLVAAHALSTAGEAGKEALQLAEEYQGMKRAGATAEELLVQQGKVQQAIQAVAKAQGTLKTTVAAGRAGGALFGGQGASSVVDGIKEKDASKILGGLGQIALAGAGEVGLDRAGGLESAVGGSVEAEAFRKYQEARQAGAPEATPPPEEHARLLEDELHLAKTEATADHLEEAAKEVRKAGGVSASAQQEKPSKQDETGPKEPQKVETQQTGTVSVSAAEELGVEAGKAPQEEPAKASTLAISTPAEEVDVSPVEEESKPAKFYPPSRFREEELKRKETRRVPFTSGKAAVAAPAETAVEPGGQITPSQEKITAEATPIQEERRTIPRAVGGPDFMRTTRLNQLRTELADPNLPAEDRAIMQQQFDDMKANPFEKHEGGDINQMKAAGEKTISREEAQANVEQRKEGRNERFKEASAVEEAGGPGAVAKGAPAVQEGLSGQERVLAESGADRGVGEAVPKRRVPFASKTEVKALLKGTPSTHGLRQARFFANLQRNPIEKEFAQSYLDARLKGESEPKPIATLSAHRAAQLKSSIESRLATKQPATLAERHSPETIAEAKAELHAAYNLASDFDRPGRYHPDLGEGVKVKEQDRVWYGVSSSRHIVAEQFPWYGKIKQGADKIGELVKKGKGAEYERLLGDIAESIQREKDSAAPVMAEFAPKLKSLADEIDGADQELSDSLAQLANADGRGFTNLRQYIEKKVNDGEQSRDFYKLIDDAAAEARQAGAEETAEPRSELRPEESRKTPTEKQSALPGFESAIEEQKAGAETVRGEKLTEEANRPLGSIEQAAGKMERESPLFRGTAASPQNEMFAPAAIGYRVQITDGPLKGKTAEVTNATPEGGVYVRGEDSSRIRYVKKGDFEAAPKEEEPAEKPKLIGVTAYSNPLFDPELWKSTLGYLKPSEAAGQPDLRARTGELARKQAVLQEKLKKERRRWRGRSDGDMLAFADLVENGEADRKARGVTLTPKTQAMLDAGKKSITAKDHNLAATLRVLLDEGRKAVQDLGTGKLQNFIENYFPHIWEQKGSKVGAAFGMVLGKRPLEGPKSFLKKREIPTTAEGFDKDLKPVTTNPVDMAIVKMHEMNRFVMAHRLLDDMKAAKTAQFVSFAEKAPEGWKPLDDKVFTVYGNPDIPVKEYYDEAVWDSLHKLAKNLGIDHERKVNIGGTRLGYTQQGSDEIVTRFATPEQVIAHEIGHQMDWKYGLKGKLVKTSPYKEELRKLVDLKWEGKDAADVPQSFRRYIRKGEEKMAAMVETLVHAPEKFKEAAPQTWKFLQDFIADKPELKPLLNVKPSMKFGVRTSTVNAGGMVIHGRYYAPEEIAQPINRYVSTGLRGHPLYDVVRGFGNSLNQVQLGISGFHLGTTSLNSVISQFALATKQMAHGQVLKAAMNALTAPIAPLRNLIQGGNVAKDYLRPDQAKKYAATAQAVEQAGGRVGIGEEYIDNRIERMLQSFANKKHFKGILQSIPAAVEAQAIPVLKWIVPRMKLGAFHDLAADILTRAQKKNWPQEQIRSELQKSWDSIDNRFGQVVYDNLNWNKMVKDLAFIGVRSVGWNYGTWRELGGGVRDAAAQAGAAMNGKGFDVTDRMAYSFMLPITIALLGALYMYAHTKKWPESAKDYFFPKNGKHEEDGTEARSSLPSYMKDVFSMYQHPVDTSLHKINPGLSVMIEMTENKDYYGNEIRNTDDPAMAQLWQALGHVGKSFLPFTLRNMQKQKQIGEKGIEPKLETFMGITPAARNIERTDAEALAHELIQRRAPAGAHTAAEQKKRDRIFQLEQDARSGALTLDNLKQRLAKGEITKEDVVTATKNISTPGLERSFKELTLPEALKVWDVASAKERNELKVVLAEKAKGLLKMTSEDVKVYAPLVRRALLQANAPEKPAYRMPFTRKTEAAPAEARP